MWEELRSRQCKSLLTQLETTRKCIIRRIANIQRATSVAEDSVKTMLCKRMVKIDSSQQCSQRYEIYLLGCVTSIKRHNQLGCYSVQLEFCFFLQKLFIYVMLRLYTEFQCSTMIGTGEKNYGGVCGVGGVAELQKRVHLPSNLIPIISIFLHYAKLKAGMCNCNIYYV